MFMSPRAALLLLFSFETLIFYAQISDQIAPYFPRGYDQISYFVASHRLLQRFFTDGWIIFWHDLRQGQVPTGATFPMQGAVLALFGGANRTGMVSLNLIYFIAAQAMVFATVLKRTGHVAYGWFAIALMLSLFGLFKIGGGIYDYRIDFSAMCLYGIWVCAILNTDAWSDRRWSIIAALIGALLISMRYLTITYVGPVLLVLFAVFLVQRWRGMLQATARALNVFICGALTLGLTVPLFYLARYAIYHYYGIGHFLGVEKHIRAQEVGVASLADHLAFYPKNILALQLGRAFLVIAAALIIFAVIRRVLRPAAATARYWFDLATLALAAVVPLAVLTLGTSKSPVVAGIVSIPLVLMVVLGAAALRDRDGGDRVADRVAAGLAMTVGGLAFVTHAATAQHYLSKLDLATINRLNGAIARHIIESHKPTQRVSFDRVIEFFTEPGVTLEVLQQVNLRHPVAPYPLPGLGGIFAVTREEILRTLESTDILVLSDHRSARGDPWPFNDSMREHWPDLESYATSNLVVLDSGTVGDIPYRVFVRPR